MSRALAVPRAHLSPTLDRVPAPALFVVGAVSQYAGAAVAVLLFSAVPAEGVAWSRVLAAALFLCAWRRPWRDGWAVLRPGRLRLVVAFGTVLAAMNICFYLAIARLPLGTAVAIEFLGPIAVAAAGSRSRRQLLALGLAVSGVGLLAEVSFAGSPSGVALALAAAALWAAYIVLGHRVAGAGDGLDGLAVGMLAGALILAPVGAPSALPALADPGLALRCAGVGLLSSVVPYALDQRVLARTGPGRFALLLCLLPATAALVGAGLLGQTPSAAEAAGIALVVAAVAARGAS